MEPSTRGIRGKPKLVTIESLELEEQLVSSVVQRIPTRDWDDSSELRFCNRNLPSFESCKRKNVMQERTKILRITPEIPSLQH
jgi:hypothetical protein